MRKSQPRAGHVRHGRRGSFARAIAALTAMVSVTGVLVTSQLTPQEAHAAQEPAATGIDVGAVRANMGTGIVNASETDTTTSLPDNFIRYGIVPGMSPTPFSSAGVNGGKPITDSKPVGTFLGGTVAKQKDLWTYIARGAPWKWDDQTNNTGPGDSQDSKDWMDAHYKQWHDGGTGKIWVNGQSAIGFKPNDPGTVQPGQTFLLGAIRHNNLPIQGGANVKQYLHSTLQLTIPNLTGSQPEAYPFVNYESYNTLSSTIMYRKGGAYIKHPGIGGTDTCRTDIGINGKSATEPALPASGVQFLRDAVMDQGIYYGTPQWAKKNGQFVLDENGQKQFIGTAYEPDPIDPSDRSKGYVNKPESQSGRYYCVKYVGEGNGDYDLYSQYYNKGAEQPYSHVTAKKIGRASCRERV